MSSELSDKKCIPCEGNIEPFNQAEAEDLMREVSEGWKLVDGKEIRKEFSFRDFAEALAFVNSIGAIAESEGHHPNIFLHNWNKVGLTLSTHAIGGLTENDFILAAKVDRIRNVK
jgi:4a-hydroxytetrahydrobiopterin dehydratase